MKTIVKSTREIRRLNEEEARDAAMNRFIAENEGEALTRKELCFFWATVAIISLVGNAFLGFKIASLFGFKGVF